MIKPKEPNYDKRFLGKHFHIRFDPVRVKYYLKDLGHGFGTFVKINKSTLIKPNSLVNIGENYLVFTFGIENDGIDERTGMNNLNNDSVDNEKIINIKIFSGIIKHTVYSYSPSKSPFTIGRSPENEVIIEEGMLSRIHCTVEYFDNNWYISDGNTLNKNNIKRSTNGTWIYALEEIEIFDQMTFKANHNLFVCSFSSNINV